MQTSFIEGSTALFNIATKNISEIMSTEQDTFIYLKNSINILSNSFYIQGEWYMNELHKIIKNRNYFYYWLCYYFFNFNFYLFYYYLFI